MGVALGLLEDYREYGADVIAGLRRNDPLGYIKLALWISPFFEATLKQHAADMSDKDRLRWLKTAAEILEKKMATPSPPAS
jgi:hypothetical protein